MSLIQTSQAMQILAGNNGDRIVFNGTSATWRMPAPVPNFEVQILNVGSGNLTLQPDGGGINAGTTVVVPAGVGGSLASDGITWFFFGNVASPSASGTVTSVATGTGLSGGPITGSGTIAMANTAVTPGSYTNMSATVDQQGRITTAANGSTPLLAANNLSDVANAGTSRTNLGVLAAVSTIRDVAGTTDIIVAADHGQAVRYTGGSAIAVDVPLGLGAGFTCLLLQTGAGVFTVSGSGGATVENRQSQLSSAGDNAICSLFADAANHLIFGGDTA